MDLDRFDDDNRPRNVRKTITLRDGRQFSHKHIFDTLRTSGLKEPYMKEAFHQLLINTPISIDTRPVIGDTIDIESFFRRPKRDLEHSQEIVVKLEPDGIYSTDVRFHDALMRNGITFAIK